ncbi:hypothetical protein Q73A0000_04470 [Kaistella flava (ex Peng et al. 2021)]|uniref:DUF3278 domain-containing protein n=1 Tax=Kaistella flava (ex Peng et al. 2021) TaxID=2038776 RepID=A0A7M2Y695_9FLAO|nr:hypothetical protein [Kaistella flava (ex Peng et al. 2021)]QOW09671.1 hypothetical protein Q73A0000_04470 [Kaistella flava (ex Peng et al. 2021)]
MELDQLKNIWGKEEVTETPEISTEKQKEIHLPLGKIRKNMRTEFWSTAVMFLLIIVFFALKDMYIFKFKVYVITLVSAQMLVTSFYFFKFFNLYKNLTAVDFNTADSLRELGYQFKLNKQYYLSFYISFVPFVVCEMLLIFEFTPSLKSIQGLEFILTFLGLCLFTLLLLYFVGTWWFKRYYGKYISQITQITKNLK